MRRWMPRHPPGWRRAGGRPGSIPTTSTRHPGGTNCLRPASPAHCNGRAGADRPDEQAMGDDSQDPSSLDAFRAALGDRLRSLSSAEDIVATASEMLGRRLAVSRVVYAEVD